MATGEELPDVSGLLAILRQGTSEPGHSFPYEPEDLSRLSVESLLRARQGTARSLHSSGTLRFSGMGVEGHSANLDDLGQLSSAWQRAITATGAALEDRKTIRGRVSDSVRLRTQLILTASPQPGSVVFAFEPKQPPMSEAQPDGQAALTKSMTPRPLADRAAERLVALLAGGGERGPGMADEIASQLFELGPRVGGAVNMLARAIERSNITLDASWREPEAPTRRVRVDPPTAKFIVEVVEGRGLDAVPVTLSGSLQTISSRQRWVIETQDSPVWFDAAQLPDSELHRWKVGDVVEVDATVSMRQRGDGRIDRTYFATSIRQTEKPPPLLDVEDL